MKHTGRCTCCSPIRTLCRFQCAVAEQRCALNRYRGTKQHDELVYMHVCLSVYPRAYLKNCVSKLHKLHITCSRGWVLFQQRYDIYCVLPVLCITLCLPISDGNWAYAQSDSPEAAPIRGRSLMSIRLPCCCCQGWNWVTFCDPATQ